MRDTSNDMITGKDGFYVAAWLEAGAWWMCAGHDKVVGGLFGEWSDCETYKDRRLRARRMIARARKEGESWLR